MSDARKEILRLIADGRITPEEGDRLLTALEGPSAGSRMDPSDVAGDAQGGRGGRLADGIAQVVEEVGETVRRAMEDAFGSAQRAFDEHRATTESVEIREGRFAMPPGGRLKVQQAIRLSFGGGSKGGNVILRPAQDDSVRVVRGEAVEAHRNGTDFVLTWAKGNLELEIPRRLAGLDVRCMGGDLEVVDFAGPMTLETMGGELRVQAPSAPFKFRTLGGKVRVVDCALREGTATINSTGGDVTVQFASGASATVRASSLGGTFDLPPGASGEGQGRALRRATCTIGSGAAEMRIDTLGGDVRIRET